jgi:hypothetical protein
LLNPDEFTRYSAEDRISADGGSMQEKYLAAPAAEDFSEGANLKR